MEKICGFCKGEATYALVFHLPSQCGEMYVCEKHAKENIGLVFHKDWESTYLGDAFRKTGEIDLSPSTKIVKI